MEISVREDLKNDMPDEIIPRIVQNNTLHNMDPLCQKNSRMMFKKGQQQLDEISKWNLENCIDKNSCEWTPEFINDLKDEHSDICRSRIVGKYPELPEFKETSNEFLILYNCLSDTVTFPVG